MNRRERRAEAAKARRPISPAVALVLPHSTPAEVGTMAAAVMRAVYTCRVAPGVMSAEEQRALACVVIAAQQVASLDDMPLRDNLVQRFAEFFPDLVKRNAVGQKDLQTDMDRAGGADELAECCRLTGAVLEAVPDSADIQ